MTLPLALLVLAGIVLATIGAGVALQRTKTRTRRIAPATGSASSPADHPTEAIAADSNGAASNPAARGKDVPLELSDTGLSKWGRRATLVQFSTEYCARCPGVRRALGEITAPEDDIDFVHIDLTDRPDLAKKYRVMQTPAVFLVDGDGSTRTRLSGALSRQLLTREIVELAGAIR